MPDFLPPVVASLTGEVSGFLAAMATATVAMKATEDAGNASFANIGGAMEKWATDAANSSSGVVASLGKVGLAMSDVSGAQLAMAAGGVVAAAGFADFAAKGVSAFENLGVSVYKAQLVSGASAQSVSELMYAYTQVGGSADGLTPVLARLGRSIEDHSNIWAAYGIQIDRTKAGQIDILGTIENLASAFQNQSSAAQGDAMVMDLLGSRGGAAGSQMAALLPLLSLTKDQLAAFAQQAKDSGLVMDESMVQKSIDLQHSLNDLSQTFKGLEVSVGGSLASGFSSFLGTISSGVQSIEAVSNALNLPVASLVELGIAIPLAEKGLSVLATAFGTSAAAATADAAASVADTTAEAALAAAETAEAEAATAAAAAHETLTAAKGADAAASVADTAAQTGLLGSLGAMAGDIAAGIAALPLGTLTLIGAAAYEAGNGLENLRDHFLQLNSSFDESQLPQWMQGGAGLVTAAATATGQSLSQLQQQMDETGLSAQKLYQAWQQHVTAEQDAIDKANETKNGMAGLGLTYQQVVSDLGLGSDNIVADFKANEDAVNAFIQSIQQGVDAAAKAFESQTSVLGNFDESGLEKAQQQADQLASKEQAVSDAQDQATQRQQDSAQAVADAQSNLSDAEESAAERQSDAATSVARAEENAADVRVAAAQRVQDAIDQATSANEDAAKSVVDAEQKLSDLQARQAAGNDPARARAISAAQELRNAEQAVTDAQEKQADTQASGAKSVANAQAQSAKDIESAENSLTDALKNQQRAAEENAKSLEQAQDGVSKALENQAKAAAESAKAIQAAEQALEDFQTKSSSTLSFTDQQVEDFFNQQLTLTTNFNDGIKKAEAEGFDPAFISMLMQEGPAQAAPWIQRILNDNNDNLKNIVNTGESNLGDQENTMKAMQSATEVAINSTNDRVKGEVTDAGRIIEALMSSNGTESANALADQLGIAVPRVQQIMTDYQSAIMTALNPILKGMGLPEITSAADLEAKQKFGVLPIPVRSIAADGGFTDAMIGNGSNRFTVLNWDEPETGGEAMIPMSPSKRGRSEPILAEVANRFGFGLMKMADGGVIPQPPDLSAYGDMIGYTGASVDDFMFKAAKSILANASTMAPGGVVPGDVVSWLTEAIHDTGVAMSWLGGLETIAMHESGGSPTIVNTWDSNYLAGHPSIGLMQVIQPTFDAYALPGHDDIRNPVDNAIAAIRYIESRYGDISNVPGLRSMAAGGAYQGYHDGGIVGSAGTSSDDVLAVLQRGEGVVSRGAMAGGGGITVQVIFQGPVAGDNGWRDIGEKVADSVQAALLRKGRSNVSPLAGLAGR